MFSCEGFLCRLQRENEKRREIWKSFQRIHARNDMNTDALKNYLRPGYFRLFVSGGAVVAGILLAVYSKAGNSSFLFAVFGVCIAFFPARSWYSLYKEYLDFIATHQQAGNLDDVAADFAAGKAWFNDRIRTGQTALYIKGVPCLLDYDDILNLYEYIHKTNYVEDERQLIAVIKGGTKISLCKLKKNGQSNQELLLFLAFLFQKNPDVTVGYSRSKELDASTIKYGRQKTWQCECGQENPISRITCMKCGSTKKAEGGEI